MAQECGDSTAAGVAAAFVMAIIPAHAQRSVGGGFDNESVAIAPMCAACYFWCRAVRGRPSGGAGRGVAAGCFAVLAGLAYAAMAASWGGYVYMVNLIGAHAFAMAVQRGWRAVHLPYTLFFVVGTTVAVHVPVVGWTPLRSMVRPETPNQHTSRCFV